MNGTLNYKIISMISYIFFFIFLNRFNPGRTCNNFGLRNPSIFPDSIFIHSGSRSQPGDARLYNRGWECNDDNCNIGIKLST